MRSLFVKIFLSFWVAQALFLVLAILATIALHPPRESSGVEALQSKFLSEAVDAYQQGGEEGTRKYLRGIHDSQHLRLYLFDGNGKELTGRTAPPWIDRVYKGQEHTIDSFWGRIGPGQFLRPTMTTADGKRFTMVIELPPELHGKFGMHGVPGMGIAIAVISSGLVCYFLAGYLTKPVSRLRAATRKLAAGDLSARAGVPPVRGNDEVSQLVRDFDAMAERLENVMNAQSRLLNDISHELRSPLARLNVALGLARQRAGELAQPALERIDLEADRLNEMIGRLLTIARLESGVTMEKVPIQLADLVAAIAADADYEAQSHDSHVASVVEDECVVMGDLALLHSAIENVVRNAMRYTTPGTEVQVRLRCDQNSGERQAVVLVSDSGPGVPEEALDKLFRPFYRIDDARGRQTGGVGLGLSITERAVRLHGGAVRATNRPEGGLQIEIRLPMDNAALFSPAGPQEDVSLRTAPHSSPASIDG